MTEIDLGDLIGLVILLAVSVVAFVIGERWLAVGVVVGLIPYIWRIIHD